jgi:uncharacterized protein YkwD
MPESPPSAHSESPAAAAQYTTAARSDGVVGGPRAMRLAKQVREALRARGDDGEPDGALAAVAVWLAEKGSAARQQDVADVAQRVGFPGAVSTATAFTLGAGVDDVWREALADIARNLPVTRYGVYVSPNDVAAIVFGRMEVTLDPFARRFKSGETCRLRGQVSARYARASVYLTRPDGKVDETPMAGRLIDASLRLSGPGVYRVEVMSEGASGPVVLANVPLYVGVDEPAQQPAARAGAHKTSVPAEAEARMLALLNDVRRDAKLAPLAIDAQLRAVASAHTQDMISSRFFGHASPTTGMVENRLERAGVVVSLAGENVAQADDADALHRVLMDSPAHRANMLGAKFTHVGIGVGLRPGDSGDLLATLVFARRPPPLSTPVTPAQATAVISSLRRAKGSGPLRVDATLQKAAEAGIRVVAAGGAVSPDQAVDAAHDALVRESKRLRVGRHAICIALAQVLELDELEQDPILLQPRPLTVGLGTATRQIGQVTKIFVLVVAEGATCQ